MKTFKCSICGFKYKDEETANKCKAYCEKHNACSIEITKKEIK